MKKYFPVLQYINVPNALTTIGMGFGVVACYFLLQGNLRAVYFCIFMATFMDLLDGYFAAKLNQQSKFGAYVDSLVDFFICCLMPMLIAQAFIGGYPLLIAAVIFYCMCGLWRLAHFNVVEGKGFFTGMPVPGGLMLVSMGIWPVVRFGLPYWVSVIVFFATGLLMVSFIRLEKYGIWQKVMAAVGLIFLVFVLIG